MQLAEASFLLEFLLPILKSEQLITFKILAAVPPDHQNYRPDAKSRSALELARHIALTEIWFLDGILTQRFDEIILPPDSMRTCLEVAQWYAENFAQRLSRLQALSGTDLTTPVDWIGLRKDPAVTYLNIAIRHSVHHRGQLSAYLRPMGAKVPAIYVESGDEPFPPADGSIPIKQPPAF